jgi:hypothetical protein
VDVRVRHACRWALRHPCAFSVPDRLLDLLKWVQDDALWSGAHDHQKLDSEAASDRDVWVRAIAALGVRFAFKVGGVHARLTNDDVYLHNLGRVCSIDPLLSRHAILHPFQLEDLSGNRGHVKGHNH